MGLLMPNSLHNAMHNHIQNGNWDSALATAKQIPSNHNAFEQMPSSGEMPDDAIHHAIAHLDKNPDKSHKNGFLFELANNLPENTSKETLNEILNHATDDHYVAEKVKSHPNFSLTPENEEKQKAIDFWSQYEKKVTPSAFATIKSLYSGKPETIKDHRGQSGTSQDSAHLLP